MEVRNLTVRFALMAAFVATIWPFGAAAQDLPEYRLKAAFLYNFMAYTEWPPEVGTPLTLCVVGNDPFGKDIDALQGRAVGQRSVAVQRKTAAESLNGCHAVFICSSAQEVLTRVLEGLRGKPVLTLADSPGAMQRGVALNMNMARDKVSFEANLGAARAAGLQLSSKLLRLATEVQQ